MLLNMKSKSEIISEIIKYIKSRFPLADMVPNTVIRDLAVEAPATYFFDTYKVVALLEQILDLNILENLLKNVDERARIASTLGLTIEEVESMFKTIVNLYAGNFGIVRKAGTKATGEVYFYAINSADIPVDGIFIPAGTRVGVAGTGLTFKTLNDVTLKKESSYFNSISQAYEVCAMAEAEKPGISGNVPEFSITEILEGQFVNLKVINYNRFSNGTDEEDDLSLLKRIRYIYTGNFHGTANSILSRVLSNPYVKDATVLLPGDPEKISPDLGEVDVIAKAESTVSKTETVQYMSMYNNCIKLSEDYVSYISSVKILDNNYTFNPYTYEIKLNNEGKSFIHFKEFSTKDYTFKMIDNVNIYIRYGIPIPNTDQYVIFPDGEQPDGTNVIDFGRIEVILIKKDALSGQLFITNDTSNWKFTGIPTMIKRPFLAGPIAEASFFIRLKPKENEDVSVTYRYNNIFKELKDYLNNPSVLFLGQRINIFPATEVPINIKVIVQVGTDYNLLAKEIECKTALTTYLSSLPMGSKIDETKIVDVLLGVPGVIDVKLPLLELSTPSYTGTSDIILSKKEFPVAGDIKIIAQFEEVINA